MYNLIGYNRHTYNQQGMLQTWSPVLSWSFILKLSTEPRTKDLQIFFRSDRCVMIFTCALEIENILEK